MSSIHLSQPHPGDTIFKELETVKADNAALLRDARILLGSVEAYWDMIDSPEPDDAFIVRSIKAALSQTHPGNELLKRLAELEAENMELEAQIDGLSRLCGRG